MLITMRLGIHLLGEGLADRFIVLSGRNGGTRPYEDKFPIALISLWPRKSFDRGDIGCPPLSQRRTGSKSRSMEQWQCRINDLVGNPPWWEIPLEKIHTIEYPYPRLQSEVQNGSD
jgi:hypothetical protein